MQKQYDKNAWEKSNYAYSLSIRVQTTINHISMFLRFYFLYQNINVEEDFFFSARAEKGLARLIDASSRVET